MENHFHSLQEAKVYVNAKTPYTLASLTEGFLKKMRDNPDVPPSMKERLETALMIKKDGVKGGLAGVSKASGFIQRMMAENNKKHNGQYKKPTDPAHKDSTMSAWRPFDYKKLANATQSGTNTSQYGASPFIQKYFKNGTVKFERGHTAKETEPQRKARLLASAKLLLKRSKQLIKNNAPQEIIQETQRVAEEANEEANEILDVREPPAGLEVKPKRKIQIKKTSPKPATPANPEPTQEPTQDLSVPGEEALREPAKPATPKEFEDIKDPVSRERVMKVAPHRLKKGSSHYKFDFDSLYDKPNHITNEWCNMFMKEVDRYLKRVNDCLTKYPDYVLTWQWGENLYDKFVLGSGHFGYVPYELGVPYSDDYRLPRYEEGRYPSWFKKLPIPSGRVNPPEYVKILRGLIVRLNVFKGNTETAFKNGVWEVIEKVSKRNGGHYTVVDLAGKEYSSGVSYPNKESKAYLEEAYNLTKDIDMYITGLNGTPFGGYNNHNMDDNIKMTQATIQDKINQIDSMVSVLSELKTRADFKKRNQNIKDWILWQKAWREKFLARDPTDDALESLPTGEEVPHTPDEIGMGMSIFPYIDNRLIGYEEEAARIEIENKTYKPPKVRAEEKEKVRSGFSGKKREALIKEILEEDSTLSLVKIAEKLKEKGDTGAGGKALSASTLSPLVKKVKESLKGSGSYEPVMCGI